VDRWDDELDALLDGAAPDGPSPDFVDRVVASVRARRRGRRVRRVAGLVAAAALVVAALGLPRAERQAEPTAHAQKDPVEVVAETQAGESYAFALPADEGHGRQFMMARVDGAVIMASFPRAEPRLEPTDAPRPSGTMVGWVTADNDGPSYAIAFD